MYLSSELDAVLRRFFLCCETCWPPLLERYIFWGVRKISIKATISFVMSVCPHGTTRLPLDEFSLNFIFENISKNCRENSSFIKIWQEQHVLDMKTNIHSWSYLAQFFVEWETFQTKVVEEIKTHILFSVTFFRISCLLWDKVEKYCRAGQATETIWRMRIECWITKAVDTRSQYAILIAFPLQQWLHERA